MHTLSRIEREALSEWRAEMALYSQGEHYGPNQATVYFHANTPGDQDRHWAGETEEHRYSYPSPTHPQSSATFVYNGDGLRIRKTEQGAVRNYLFDGVRVYGEYDTNWNETARYITTGPSYGDGLAAIRWGGAWYYPLYDGLGSVRKVVDWNQSLTHTYSYDAFGNVTAQSEAFPNPYRYVGYLGYHQDSTTSLQHPSAG